MQQVIHRHGSEMDDNTVQVPERQLLAAVLKRALFDYFGDDKTEKDLAAAWLFEEACPPEPVVRMPEVRLAEVGISEDPALFSFKWVCDQLDINPCLFLERLRNVRPRGSRRPQEWWYELRFAQN